MNLEKYQHISFTYATKGKNPFTGEGDYATLVPSLKQQQGKKVNFVVVTCEPHRNGVYKYDASKTNNFARGLNGKITCLYIPIEECKLIQTLEEVTDPYIKDCIKYQQDKWFKGEVKNNPKKYPNGKPDGMLK